MPSEDTMLLKNLDTGEMMILDLATGCVSPQVKRPETTILVTTTNGEEAARDTCDPPELKAMLTKLKSSREALESIDESQGAMGQAVKDSRNQYGIMVEKVHFLTASLKEQEKAMRRYLAAKSEVLRRMKDLAGEASPLSGVMQSLADAEEAEREQIEAVCGVFARESVDACEAWQSTMEESMEPLYSVHASAKLDYYHYKDKLDHLLTKEGHELLKHSAGRRAQPLGTIDAKIERNGLKFGAAHDNLRRSVASIVDATHASTGEAYVELLPLLVAFLNFDMAMPKHNGIVQDAVEEVADLMNENHASLSERIGAARQLVAEELLRKKLSPTTSPRRRERIAHFASSGNHRRSGSWRGPMGSPSLGRPSLQKALSTTSVVSTTSVSTDEYEDDLSPSRIRPASFSPRASLSDYLAIEAKDAGRENNNPLRERGMSAGSFGVPAAAAEGHVSHDFGTSNMPADITDLREDAEGQKNSRDARTAETCVTPKNPKRTSYDLSTITTTPEASDALTNSTAATVDGHISRSDVGIDAAETYDANYYYADAGNDERDTPRECGITKAAAAAAYGPHDGADHKEEHKEEEEEFNPRENDERNPIFFIELTTLDEEAQAEDFDEEPQNEEDLFVDDDTGETFQTPANAGDANDKDNECVANNEDPRECGTAAETCRVAAYHADAKDEGQILVECGTA